MIAVAEPICGRKARYYGRIIGVTDREDRSPVPYCEDCTWIGGTIRTANGPQHISRVQMLQHWSERPAEAHEVCSVPKGTGLEAK